ncbi:PREDICTED: phosducin-like protein [Polistes dominula]|uniref:Phosducin-like protein n=1 Tax=Polistes dominula TaxID=743375 RepID=A0ABM1JB88_POLDO|nr:PREDICTED: phosducin-like protein [Polistes dominula]XP_015189725.1 PREDICTED: phosducin-like protein [Polistes dominula]XP_015189726.1 PREDICTED: phosducin-like protein [Polistes dominula]
MSTLEDKILGEKTHYYCSSSSEDENDSEDSNNVDKENKYSSSVYNLSPSYSNAPSNFVWDGSSSNTGPKGVIKDWQRFKQIETEKRAMLEKERLEIIKKASFTCRTDLDEEKAKLEETDPELADLLSDEFLITYQKQRMKELLEKVHKEHERHFGELITLETADAFVDAIDNEDKFVTVIIHIYEDKVYGCKEMNSTLSTLAKEYPSYKFCRISGSVAGLSRSFKEKGVPALLVYKEGQLIGNFVKLNDQLESNFTPTHVETFLVENGILPNRCGIRDIII